MSSKVVDWLHALLAVRGTALVGVDLDGRTTFWSRGAEALFGWTAEEILGRPLPIVPKSLQQEWELKLQRVFETDLPTPAAETQRITREGRTIWVVHSSSPVHGENGEVIGLLDTLMDITALRQLDEESRALAQVRERELVAMDLHDGLIQALYATVLNLAAQERSLDASETDSRRALEAARADIQRVIEETRSYVLNLREREFAPPNLEVGLRLLADALRLGSRMDVQVTIDPSIESVLPSDTRRHLLYLVREAVSNVLRHAHANRVWIELTRSDESASLCVADNGQGFDSESRSEARLHKHGIHNMAERARLIGARLDISSGQGSGTQIRLELPLQA